MLRIRTLIIITLTAATLAVLTLAGVNLSTNWRLQALTSAQEKAQAAAHEVSVLLVLTHEYALHAEPRAAYQWHKRLDHLLLTLGEQETLPADMIDQAGSLKGLFTQLVSSRADIDSDLRRQRTEILLDQLLTTTQALSDQLYALSVETESRREATEQLFHASSLAIPIISLLALTLTAIVLAIRVLRPLKVMRKAVDAVAKGDLSVRSDTGSQDELGELSRAFDTMALDLVTHLKQEIAERQTIEENLQSIVDERTASLKAIVDTAADGIIVIHESGAILSANQAAEDIFGYHASEMIGRNVSMLMPQPHQNAHDGYIQRYLSSGVARILGSGIEVEGQRKDGHLFPVYLAISEVILANERRFTGIVRDITKQKHTERALVAARDEAECANAAKSEFLSRMSHELRTPMNAILGFSQLMALDGALPATHRENVQEILHASHHLLKLINEVLDLSRIESGHIDLTIVSVELCPIIEECLRLVTNQAATRHIQMSHDGLQDIMVRADSTRLKQALINLLSNAIKYNREGGSVHIDVKREGEDRVRILIADTGPGIPPARRGELFQPFSRLDAAHSAIEGTGIGLTITRRIIEMMGGTVDVESETDVGSTFWIELPLESAPGFVRDDKRVAEYTVLYIEDDPTNIKLITQILRRRPHIHLLPALSPVLGIELALKHKPDLILLDINMPGMDGYQVLEVIKADAALKHIPVVAVTSDAMPSDIARGMAAGFTDYLTKPLDVAQFNAMIERQLAQQNTDVAMWRKSDA